MSEALNLRGALSQLRTQPTGEDTPEYTIGLACSFTPLHLETFLIAYVLQRRPATRVRLESGIYGDLAGGVRRIGALQVGTCVIVVEWPDVDPRLGWRETVGAALADEDDICDTALSRLDRLAARIEALGSECQVALVLPTLDLPPAYSGRHERMSAFQVRLQTLVSAFAARVAARRGCWVVPPGNIGSGSTTEGRDLATEIRSGFPYSVDHASAVARAAVDALVPPDAKKGLITDLDDTVWRGLVGEIGVDNVAWDLDSGAHAHALYQRLLASLAARGVLVAIASKNDPKVVAEALRRSDLLVGADSIYPVAVSWRPKSVSIAEILEAWNIGASDVVFVDDDPMELAQVSAQFPHITTKQFPTNDPNAVSCLLGELVDMFWRESIHAEDRLRLNSLRSAVEVEMARSSADDEPGFLRDLAGTVTIDADQALHQDRARELVNKTNQFNLNGRRLDEAQWSDLYSRPGAFVWTVSYEDRFGPLGIVSVLAGTRTGRTITIDCWVQSCRAFSRAIEYHVLRVLCEQDDLDEIVLEFAPTERNAVLASLVDEISSVSEGSTLQLDCDALRDHAVGDIHRVEFSSADARG